MEAEKKQDRAARLVRFRGSYEMSPARFRECSLAMSYWQLTVLMSVFFAILLVLFGVCWWLGDMKLMSALSGGYSVMFIYLLYLAETSWRKNLKKRQLSMGEAVPQASEEFGDRIYAHTPGRSEVAYTYGVVLGIFETEHFLILRMKYNLALMADKKTLEGGTPEELKEFLFKRCLNLKSKRIETMRGKRPWCIFLTVLTIGLFAACIMMA